MRVLIVNSFYYPEIEGGAEYSVKLLAEQLGNDGHDVAVLCTATKNSVEIINNVKVYRFKSNCISRAKECINKPSVIRKIHRLLDIYNPFNYIILKQYFDEIKPDIVHTNGLYDISPIIWTVAKRKKIPVIHTLRDYYLICEHGNMLRCKSEVSCCYAGFVCNTYRWINAIFSHNVNVVTAPSLITLNTVCNKGLFKNSVKKVIYNASKLNVNKIKEISAKRNEHLNDNLIYNFVYLGALSEHKGVKWLIESIQEIDNPHVRLIIAGKGPLEDFVISSSYEDSRIIYKGFLTNEQIKNILLDAYMLVCPSLWNEPFGRVVLDAYQMSLPVIATDMGALPSIVQDKFTGYVINHVDHKSLKNAIEKSINDKEMQKFMINNIPKYTERFTIKNQVKEFIKLYQLVRMHECNKYDKS